MFQINNKSKRGLPFGCIIEIKINENKRLYTPVNMYKHLWFTICVRVEGEANNMITIH